MISEKVQQLKDDLDNVYSKGSSDGYKLGQNEMKNQIEYSITYGGKRTHYYGAFARQDWSGYSFTTPITPKDNAENMFFTYYGTTLPSGIDCSQLTGSVATMFRYSQKITDINDMNIQAPTEYKLTFANIPNLKKIEVVRCNENTKFTNTFQNDTALTDVTFEGVIGQNGLDLKASPNLSKASLLSILNCLQDKSGDNSATWTITIGNSNLGKLTAEEIESAEEKGWVIV